MKRILWALLLALLATALCCGKAGALTAGAVSAVSEKAAAAQENLVVELTVEVPTAAASPVPTPVPTPEPTEAVAPVAEPTATPVPTPFSIIWLPDTQQLSYRNPERLEQIGHWIAEHMEEQNAVCVVHTGDIVDNGYKEWQWENFDCALQAFSDRIPFVPVAGNHDIGVKLQEYDAYVQRDFLNVFPEEQKYAGGKMLYHILEAGNERILLLGIGWSAGQSEEELEWIDGVLRRYADLPCILITHGYVNDQKRILPSHRYLETKVVAKYPNIRLVLSGHSREYYTMTFSYDDDGDGIRERSVTAMMLNRQGKSYCFRVLTFDPLARTIDVKTYSPDPEQTVEENSQFGPIDFRVENAF